MTAIVVPAGPSWREDKQHLTLVYIHSTDEGAVNKVVDAVKKCILTSFHIEHSGNHHTCRHDLPRQWGKKSILVGGKAEDFKKSLHDYLVNNSEISAVIDKNYRNAHVDLKGDFGKEVYAEFRLNNLFLISNNQKTPEYVGF